MTFPLPRTLHDLPSRWAHFCLDVERFAASDLGVSLGSGRLLVGLSGGLDSSALLLVCACLAARDQGRIVAAHLDHGLRPESGQDAEQARALAESLDIPFRSIRIDVAAQAQERGLGLEDAGRRARHEFFREELEQEGLDWIVLGHHLDDLAEDVLLRLVRGTGWPGLSGMSARDEGLRLLRPLLLTPKAVLRDLAQDLGLAWREDASNQEPLFRRNRMRRNVFPLLVEENPGFLEAVARLWRLGRLDQDYWARELDLPGVQPADSPLLPDGLLETGHPALRLRLYKQVLDSLGPGQVLAETLFQLDAAWQENRLGTVFQFPGGKRAGVTLEGIRFSRKSLEK